MQWRSNNTMGAFSGVSLAIDFIAPTDYNYEGDMKKRINTIKQILTTDKYVMLNAENRAGIDVPDAADTSISKRQWEAAMGRLRNQIRETGMRQLADLACPGLWDLDSVHGGEERPGQEL